jgi:hypothetical protein
LTKLAAQVNSATTILIKVLGGIPPVDTKFMEQVKIFGVLDRFGFPAQLELMAKL